MSFVVVGTITGKNLVEHSIGYKNKVYTTGKSAATFVFASHFDFHCTCVGISVWMRNASRLPRVVIPLPRPKLIFGNAKGWPEKEFSAICEVVLKLNTKKKLTVWCPSQRHNFLLDVYSPLRISVLPHRPTR